ncbi:MAG TPA: hypothetical protein VD838_04420 [Anaeromyxobacteraceae bacterium]|nr:hypothetical protein [Anaeromyxobacteraceae bacterium]
MLFDEMLKSPTVRRAMAAGEERFGTALGKLLSSDRVSLGLQTLVSSAQLARATFERGVQTALHAANLPSQDDVASLKKKLDDLEDMLDGLSAKVDRQNAP